MLQGLPEPGQDSVLQSCSFTFLFASQAMPPLVSYVWTTRNLYCFPPPHVLVQAVQELYSPH